MQSCAERRGVDEPEGVGLRLGVSRNDQEAADAHRPWAEDPYGASVAPGSRRDGDAVDLDAERARDLLQSDAVGHDRGDRAIARDLGVQRAELDEPIERGVAGVVQIDPVRHASA